MSRRNRNEICVCEPALNLSHEGRQLCTLIYSLSHLTVPVTKSMQLCSSTAGCTASIGDTFPQTSTTVKKNLFVSSTAEGSKSPLPSHCLPQPFPGTVIYTNSGTGAVGCCISRRDAAGLRGVPVGTEERDSWPGSTVGTRRCADISEPPARRKQQHGSWYSELPSIRS